jgi:predicted Fe-Mo cluster-binding NifX family protein
MAKGVSGGPARTPKGATPKGATPKGASELRPPELELQKYRAAFASSDGKNVDLHFGKCDRFIIAEFDGAGHWRVVEERPTFALCGAGDSDESMDAAAAALSDCKFVVVSRIGRWPYAALYAKGIESVEFRGSIEDAVETLRGRSTGNSLSGHTCP